MTIRRQYSLPNCTLILEGWSNSTTGDGLQPDPRPLLTTLTNAECHLGAMKQPLSGGRDFFEDLVDSVSRYAQEFLSKVPHPKPNAEKPAKVHLQKVEDKNVHRLTLLDTPNSGAMTNSGKGLHVDLNTVQLFDLVEAIDQFLADGRTLPDISVSLQPVSKHYRQAEKPVTERTAPAALGMASLALAAIAFFFVPIPEVREPEPARTEENSNETSTSTGESDPQATPTPTPKGTPLSIEELEKVLTTAPEITDPTELRYIQRSLQKRIFRAWGNREQFAGNLNYQVSVGRDGAILGYKPVKGTPLDGADQTPLPELLYTKTTGNIATQEPIAQFQVLFKQGEDEGILEISPWNGYMGRITLGPEINDSAVINDLKGKVSQKIGDSWNKTSSYPKDLTYRVAVTEEGIIADYEAIDKESWDYSQETPLERLIKPAAAGIGGEGTGLVPQKPLGHFRVVFKTNGELDVSPYRSKE
ncbi:MULTISPECIES: DUF4335 domain-containing protein [Moorena]|uniref:DUF4335 domain-containing protein n=1 Tax=Moorena TaxID=1155738 RepID=UPI0025CC6801|nr:DUF4335 domain-containing protein [Moorena sp. SIO4G3]